jgi:hypothetical protein
VYFFGGNVTFFTNKIAEQAIDLATPLIDGLMGSGVAKRQHLAVVVALRHADATAEVEYKTLAYQWYGERSEWEYEYDQIAFKKTDISARTGLTSRQVQAMQPELLEETDVMFWGNAVLGDIIVSCSGVQPWFDEAISNAIAWLCKALIQEEVERRRKYNSGNTYDAARG